MLTHPCPAFLWFSLSFYPLLLLVSLSLSFSFLPLTLFFFLSLLKCVVSKLISGTQVKMSRSRSGFSVHISLPHPYSSFAGLPHHRAVTQSFILASGLGLFIRREGQLQTKISPLETPSLQLLRSASSLDTPQAWQISFSRLGFPVPPPISQQEGRGVTVPTSPMFWC